MYKNIIDLNENIFKDTSNKHDCSECEVQLLDMSNIEYDSFYEKYMLNNIPCIIKNVANNWPCSINWVENDNINYNYLEQEYGDMMAPVADCRESNFNAHCKSDMKVRDYISYLKDTKKEKLLYLKDWHLKRLKKDNTFYEVPHIFSSDWLNEYAIDHEDDDFMFVYIGAQNTWTPLHADVYSSYSWSVNIVGRKKWILFPPGEEKKLKDPLGNLPLLFDPNNHKNIIHIEVIQEKGDGIFVPSGWHHQVFNLLETISINHNFVNACNIEIVWEALQRNLLSVENEIKEFRETPEFTSQCQIILKSLFGLDVETFIKYITYIANKRLNLKRNKQYLFFKMYTLGTNHIDFDLKVILKLINSILIHPLIENIEISQNLAPQLISLKENIMSALNI